MRSRRRRTAVVGTVLVAVLLLAPAAARAITPGDWRSVPYAPGHFVELTVTHDGRAIQATNSFMHADPGYCGWGGSLKEQATEPAHRDPIGTGGSFSWTLRNTQLPGSINPTVVQTTGGFDSARTGHLTVTTTGCPFGQSATFTFRLELHRRTGPLSGPGGLGIGGGLGAHTKVFVRTCARAPRRLLAHAPSRRVRRAGGGRVRLRAHRRVCTARERLHGKAARRAFGLPEVPPVIGPVPEPAGCLVGADDVSLALTGVLTSRRGWCSNVIPLVGRIQVYIDSPAGREVKDIGIGRVALVLRIDLDRRGSGADAVAEFGYRGVAGVILDGAAFRVTMRCDFAFGTPCAAGHRASDETFVASGANGEVPWRLEPGGMVGNSRDFMQPWVQVQLRGPGGFETPFVVGIPPRPRCDTELAGRGQGCVWADYAPTMVFHTNPAFKTPEIAAHIARSQLSGRPGGRAGGRPLTRLPPSQRRRNYDQSCPRALIRRFQRERKGGSCDEYPFASSAQGGRGSTVANVPVSEQRSQGGIVSTFYQDERVLPGDAFWVAVRP